MFTRLIGSEPEREHGIGARVVSLALHAAMVSGALYATINAAPTPVESVLVNPLPVFVDPTPVHGGGPPGVTRCSALCFPLPAIPVVEVPIDLPTVGSMTDVPEPAFGTGGPGAGMPGTGPVGGGTDGVYEIVDRPAAARAGNTPPAYPALLRSSRIEGTVSAHFIVDTTGHVEAASIALVSSGERLFEESVRRALLASRFVPAETQGHRVRMLVRQDFAFRLTP